MDLSQLQWQEGQTGEMKFGWIALDTFGYRKDICGYLLDIILGYSIGLYLDIDRISEMDILWISKDMFGISYLDIGWISIGYNLDI